MMIVKAIGRDGHELFVGDIVSREGDPRNLRIKAIRGQLDILFAQLCVELNPHPPFDWDPVEGLVLVKSGPRKDRVGVAVKGKAPRRKKKKRIAKRNQ